jgi:type VI secretion system protein ImpM
MPIEPVTAPAALLFGKLPKHGDFVARGADPRAREALDGWLSLTIARAGEAGAADFAAAHEAAPVWRFVCGSEAWSAGWTAGAVAPSVDRAGRRFFIVLAAVGLSPQDAGARGRALAEAMESLIYDAFCEGWDADDLHRAATRTIEAMGGASGHAPPTADAWWVADAEGRPALEQDRRPPDLMVGMAAISAREGVV